MAISALPPPAAFWLQQQLPPGKLSEWVAKASVKLLKSSSSLQSSRPDPAAQPPKQTQLYPLGVSKQQKFHGPQCHATHEKPSTSRVPAPSAARPNLQGGGRGSKHVAPEETKKFRSRHELRLT